MSKPRSPRKPAPGKVRKGLSRAPVTFDNDGNALPDLPVPKAGASKKARIEGVFGASGSGKTTYVRGCIARERPDRLMVWDRMGEFSRLGIVKPVHTLADLLKACKNRTFRVGFIPPEEASEATLKKDFSVFCAIAMAAGDAWVIAEELTDVTTASHASQGWRRVCVMGRHKGLTVFGLSQSPAWVDKRFYGNCTRIQSGRLVEPGHAQAMAKVLGVPWTQIKGLGNFTYIAVDMTTGEQTTGQVKG